MTQEERLFDLIGNLPDDLASQTDASKKKRRWIPTAVAACLVLLIGVGVWHSSHGQDAILNIDTPIHSDGTAEHIDTPEQSVKLDWPIINGATSEAAVRFTMLPVNDRLAEYHQVENPRGIPQEQCPKYLGDAYLNREGWYRTADTIGLRYLVHQEEDGSYTLWEFVSFVVYDDETLEQMKNNVEQGELTHLSEFIDRNYSLYTYAEVLETIYGITSAEDIISVTVNPANMDNTDAGKKLQKKIGSFLTAKRDDLNALYETLVNMTCYGSNHWDLIDLGDNSEEDGLLTSVRLCRYLTIETTNGTIASLKYSAAGGQFYEYSGIAYEPLDAETAAQMREIFRIES